MSAAHALCTSTEAQELRILTELHARSMTTFEIRRDLDVVQVSARIFGLRAAGHRIVTTRIVVRSDSGAFHRRVALYTLLPDA
jgi:hypothetical protein